MWEKSQTSSQIKITRLKKVYNLKSNDNVHISWKRKDLEINNETKAYVLTILHTFSKKRALSSFISLLKKI